MAFFDEGKIYRFRNLQNAGLVRDRVDLTAKKKFGFPAGRLASPRSRIWTGGELNEYLDRCPVTQHAFETLHNRPPPSKPDIPKKLHKKKPAERRKGQAA